MIWGSYSLTPRTRGPVLLYHFCSPSVRYEDSMDVGSTGISKTVTRKAPGLSRLRAHLLKVGFRNRLAVSCNLVEDVSIPPQQNQHNRLRGPMARRLTTNQEIPGSTPGVIILLLISLSSTTNISFAASQVFQPVLLRVSEISIRKGRS